MLVVKVGGGEGIPIDAVCQDVRDLTQQGERLILVHGASHETNVLSEALGKPPRFVTSVSGMQSRYTDRETLMLFCMAYVGKLNKLFVERLQQLGVNAVGLCGADGRSMEGTRKAAIKVVEDGKRRVLRDDFTGRVERVNTGLLTLLLDNGYTPVLCPPALSYESEISTSTATALPPSWRLPARPKPWSCCRTCRVCCATSTTPIPLSGALNETSLTPPWTSPRGA